MSAEDLTTLAGVSVQQDLALVSLLGLTHVERNGHHFVDGMSFASEQRAGGLRPRASRPLQPGRPVRHACASTTGGSQLGSLACPGFAVAADMDFAAMRPMPRAAAGPHRCPPIPRRPHERRAPARPVRERRGARRFHDRADAGAGRRSRVRAGRHPGSRRRGQDGADAGAHGQARGAGEARRWRRALLRSGRAQPRSMRPASRRSPATCSTGTPLRALPKLDNIVFMAAMKFGATGNPALTWAMNVHVPAIVAETFPAARIVAFSTGCVYPFVPVAERRGDRGDARRAAAGRLRQLLRRPRAHVRAFLRAPRHARPHRAPQLRDRHALRRAARRRHQGARRRRNRSSPWGTSTSSGRAMPMRWRCAAWRAPPRRPRPSM